MCLGSVLIWNAIRLQFHALFCHKGLKENVGCFCYMMIFVNFCSGLHTMKYAPTKEFSPVFLFSFHICAKHLATILNAESIFTLGMCVHVHAYMHICMFRPDRSTLSIGFCFISFYSKISVRYLFKNVSIIFRFSFFI